MTRGTTLGVLINMLRIEARLDPNPALSTNMLPLMTQSLQYTQERLYDDYDWPFLKVRRDIDTEAGERYYDFPDDMNLERVHAIDYRWGERWLPVERGITLDHYNAHDSDADARADPVLRWDVADTGPGLQFEVWPIPAAEDGVIRVSGIRKLTALVSNGDRADLDDQAIVLYAAAEILASSKDAVAQVKLQKAKKRLETLQGRVTKTRNKSFRLGGCSSEVRNDHRPTPLVAYVRDADA